MKFHIIRVKRSKTNSLLKVKIAFKQKFQAEIYFTGEMIYVEQYAAFQYTQSQ